MPRFSYLSEVRSDHLSARLVACDGVDGRPVDEGVDGPHVWFVLNGRFAVHRRAGRQVADPARALFLRPGEPFCIRHPEGCGDVCLAVGGRVAAALADGPPARATSNAAYVRLRALARALAARRPVDSLEIEEAVVGALDAAATPRRAASARAVRLAEAVAHEVAMRFDERLSLATLAAPHGVSVFALCRAFREVHGVSVHRHQQRLRVRHALAAMLDPDRTLADIAAEYGFASHAHLTSLFRRELGMPPREARRHAIAALDRTRG